MLTDERPKDRPKERPNPQKRMSSQDIPLNYDMHKRFNDITNQLEKDLSEDINNHFMSGSVDTKDTKRALNEKSVNCSENTKQIIEIIKRLNERTKYKLILNALQEVLESIGDKEVAVISVVGPSRMGKSFLLNYIMRYISDPQNGEWIGESDATLEGFESKAETDPLTSGVWFSKPYIVKQSNGKELAVILMDTQGVFDRNPLDPDSLFIFWITLLVSSCVIFNVFTDLREDFLMHFETFLNYGFLANRSKAGADDKYPFQKLVFMIRDWGVSAKHRYGSEGGQELLNRKLEIRNNNSEAIVTKRLLKESFKDISCCLMPNIGGKAGEEGFTGCVNDLNDNYVKHLKLFIENTLKSDEIMPKMINNKSITGKELLLYLEVYVDLFNGTDSPKPSDIIAATTKTSDLFLIDCLKGLHFNELKAFVKNKAFISRNELQLYNKQIKTKLFEVFASKKRSEFDDIIEDLNKRFDCDLNSNYDYIDIENENKRKEFMKVMVRKSVTDFKQLLVQNIGNKFFDEKALYEIFNECRDEVMDELKNSFNEEEEDLFANDFKILSELMDRIVTEFKSENKIRISEAKTNNSVSVNKAINLYKSKMQLMLDNNQFIDKQMFIDFEYEIKTDCRKYFLSVCTSGDMKFREIYDTEFRNRLSDLKSEYKRQNKIQFNRIIDKTDIDLIDSIQELCHKLDNNFGDICSDEEFTEKQLKLKEEIYNKFIQKCFIKDKEFLKPFKDRFFKEAKNCLITKEKEIKESVEKTNETILSDLKRKYIEELKGISAKNVVISDEELKQMNENLRNQTLSQFENEFIFKFGFDVEIYLFELKQYIDNEFNKYCSDVSRNRSNVEKGMEKMTKECLTLYEFRMNGNSCTESQLLTKHNAIRNEVFSTFYGMNQNEDKEVIDKYQRKLDSLIRNSLSQIMRSMSKSSKSDELMDRIVVKEPKVEAFVDFTDMSDITSLNIIEATIEGKYKLNERVLRQIISKAKDCNNFALISIIGQKGSGKSFYMNCLKSYLSSKDWPKNSVIDSNEGFHYSWSSGQELKPLVQMLSKPFILEDEDQRTAVFLMDSSNVFNDPTEISNTKLVEDIIGLFLTTSSTVIYLKESFLLRKDVENFKRCVIEGLKASKMSSFQELFWIIRDWSPNLFEDKTYLFGAKNGENYMKTEFGDQKMSDYFHSISSYLMPEPGGHVKGSRVSFQQLNDDFTREMLRMFKNKLLNIDEMEVKRGLDRNQCLRPEELFKLFRNHINQMNGEYNASNALTDNPNFVMSCEDYDHCFDSGESIEVIEKTSNFERLMDSVSQLTEDIDANDIQCDEECVDLLSNDFDN